MGYARWATAEEKAQITIPVNLSTNLEKSGTPIMYDDNNLYLLKNSYHTLVIGSTGSGKTQSIVLPQIKLSMKAGESLVVSDPKGELYINTANELENKGYKVSVINLENPSLGNNFNPLKFPYELYKEGNKDKCMEMIEDLGYYLFQDINSKEVYKNITEEELASFKVDSTNAHNFDQYKFTFEKDTNGNYYFKSISKVN